MNPQKVMVLGMELDEFRFASCVAHFGVGSDWATLFDITSLIEGRSHATKLLKSAKKYYKKKGKKVGGSIALNKRMSDLYKKVGIEEYRDI